MSIPFSNTHYRIPQGFGNLLEGLTREILREQPDNIPAFAAAYFENLLEKREKTSFDPAEWGAKVDDRFYNNHAFKEQESPEKHEPGKENSQTSVKEKTALITSNGDVLTAGSFLALPLKKKTILPLIKKILFSKIVNRWEKSPQEEEQTEITVSALILQIPLPPGELFTNRGCPHNTVESPEEDTDMEENAALKIQAAFRGHLAREEVKKMKSTDLEEEKTEENE